MVEENSEFPAYNSFSFIRESSLAFDTIKTRLSDLTQFYLPGIELTKTSGSGLGATRTSSSAFGTIVDRVVSINSFENSFEICNKIANLDRRENKLSRYLSNAYFCRTIIRSFGKTTLITWGSWKARPGKESYGYNLKTQFEQLYQGGIELLAAAEQQK